MKRTKLLSQHADNFALQLRTMFVMLRVNLSQYKTCIDKFSNIQEYVSIAQMEENIQQSTV